MPILYVDAGSHLILILTHRARRDDDAVRGELSGQNASRHPVRSEGVTPGVIAELRKSVPPGTGGDLRAVRSPEDTPPEASTVPSMCLLFEKRSPTAKRDMCVTSRGLLARIRCQHEQAMTYPDPHGMCPGRAAGSGVDPISIGGPERLRMALPLRASLGSARTPTGMIGMAPHPPLARGCG